MSTGLWGLQKGIYSLLLANTALQTLLGNPARVYDAPPPDPVFPLVLIGALQAQEWGTRDFDGFEVTAALHCFSNTNRGSSDIKQINAALHAALHDQPIPLTSGMVIQCRYDSTTEETLSDDGLTWRGGVNFTIYLQLNT